MSKGFCLVNIRRFILIFLLLLPLKLQASFIEATIGAAVVNDATATYYNPAALTLLKKSQFITLNSIALLQSEFSGKAIQTSTGFTQSGVTQTRTRYFLPSVYLGIPTQQFTLGIAVISNFFSEDLEDNSVLRYVESNNNVQNIDFVTAIGFKVNDSVALGAGFTLSRAHFIQQPIFGIPSLNIPDSQSRNESRGDGFGGDIGILLKPTKSTLVGFNYRGSITYPLSGTSVFAGNPQITSHHYHYKFWTPAHSVLSVNQALTSKLGVSGTLQYIEWSIIKNINLHGIATPTGILNASVPQHLHNAWIFTLGGQYRVIPKWVIRFAGTYLQSPASGNYQISNGDSFILGASTSYKIDKVISMDWSYAHAFIKNQNIHITGARNRITGVNKGSRDAVSFKLTFNI